MRSLELLDSSVSEARLLPSLPSHMSQSSPFYCLCLSWTFVTKSSWLIQELLQNSQAWASQVEFLMQLVRNGVEACMFFLNFSELYLPAQTENHYFLFLSEFQVHRTDLIILSSRHVIIVGPCNVPLLLIPFHHHTPPPFSLPPKITILTY